MERIDMKGDEAGLGKLVRLAVEGAASKGQEIILAVLVIGTGDGRMAAITARKGEEEDHHAAAALLRAALAAAERKAATAAPASKNETRQQRRQRQRRGGDTVH